MLRGIFFCHGNAVFRRFRGLGGLCKVAEGAKKPRATRGGMRPYFTVSMRAMEPFVGLASGASEFQPLDFMGLAEKVIIV